jgi:drug/metabolite transporter (DMT)-like permease
VHKLSAQTVAIFSYIDPVVAILLSALFLQEPMTVWGWVGAVLILGSTLVSELSATKKHLD